MFPAGYAACVNHAFAAGCATLTRPNGKKNISLTNYLLLIRMRDSTEFRSTEELSAFFRVPTYEFEILCSRLCLRPHRFPSWSFHWCSKGQPLSGNARATSAWQYPGPSASLRERTCCQVGYRGCWESRELGGRRGRWRGPTPRPARRCADPPSSGAIVPRRRPTVPLLPPRLACVA